MSVLQVTTYSCPDFLHKIGLHMLHAEKCSQRQKITFEVLVLVNLQPNLPKK